MNKDKIEEVLKQVLVLNERFEEEYAEIDEDELEDVFSYSEAKQLPSYTIKMEESYGGEGQGDDYWFVLSITESAILGEDLKDSIYIRFNGWYSSYNGTEWDGGFSIVYPKPVEKIEWTTTPPK